MVGQAGPVAGGLVSLFGLSSLGGSGLGRVLFCDGWAGSGGLSNSEGRYDWHGPPPALKSYLACILWLFALSGCLLAWLYCYVKFDAEPRVALTRLFQFLFLISYMVLPSRTKLGRLHFYLRFNRPRKLVINVDFLFISHILVNLLTYFGKQT